jgi:hypothetical protein
LSALLPADRILRKHSKQLGTGAKLLLIGVLFLVLEQGQDVYAELTHSSNVLLHAVFETLMLVFFLLAIIIEMRAPAKKI